jgi:hypothetical protein
MSIGQSRQDRINVLEEENYSIMAPRAQVAAIREDPLMRAVEIIPVRSLIYGSPSLLSMFVW